MAVENFLSLALGMARFKLGSRALTSTKISGLQMDTFSSHKQFT